MRLTFFPWLKRTDLVHWAALLTAIGTIGTAAVAAFVLLRDQIQRTKDGERAKRAQADRVSAWVYDDATSNEVVFMASNQSDLPVYDIVILTDDSSITRPANYNMGSLSPGQTFEARVPWAVQQTVAFDRQRAVPFAFIDASGQRWLRDGVGLLYAATRETFEAIEYPNGVVGGAAAARVHLG